MKEKNIIEENEIINYLEKWSNRKKTMFTNPQFVKIAMNKLN